MSGPPSFLESVGPMGQFYREKDWSKCELGPPEQWSAQLKGYVDMMLRVPTGMIIFWGPNQIQLYNLGYSDIMGPRHPRYLGEPYRDCWPDTFPTIYPLMRKVLDQGEVIQVTDALIPVTRYGFVEETYFTFSFVPLRNGEGAIEGFVQPIAETTKLVIAERRIETLRALAPRMDMANDAVEQALTAFRANAEDVPFAAIYVDDELTHELTLKGNIGLPDARLEMLELARSVMSSAEPRMIEDVAAVAGTTALGPWPEPLSRAMAVPLRRPGAEDTRGVLVMGLSSRLAFDESYRSFAESAARELSSNLAFERDTREQRRLHRELERRAEALTELDKAKTAFFSNVSHEFRTPLTLMLGPLDDALADPSDPLSEAQKQRITLIRRNGGRLLKLVNSLLDFNRIEAGRTRASLEPLDIATVTLDLASSFRSLVERAGLEYEVECVPIAEPVWLDREMWEKIVLNLISNAFKFTLAGKITVRIAPVGERVELSVSDTGTGIAASELPKVFERFHRVEGSKGRSFEGTGIGLALVRELVSLQQGTVRVESEEGRGTTFTVSLPTGSAHVAEGDRRPVAPPLAAAPENRYLREAASWMTDAVPAQESTPEIAESGGPSAKILLADDNADMREYITRLLSPRYSVKAVGDGLDALEAVRREAPDLVLTDVMMPRLDGFALLSALKKDPATRTIPVILLSARAGEESRVEGMEAGADDYLVKPFAARELVARVAARLEIARIHASMSDELERLVTERTAQLTEANRELESFSYSVSHDLRAPLRHILGFSQLMEKSSKGTLDKKTEGYLKTIAEAAQRGGQLVDDLLAFSRMGRAEMRLHRVDLQRLVADVRSELAPEQEGRTIDWQVEPLPEVQGDPALLRLVLKNILSNALKYTRNRPDAVIAIRAEQRPEEVEVTVSDNGVGFDMRYVDKLFGVFQRLHTNEQFEGTGIGLALVRRVIGRHGGRVWAEGELGRGAKIRFVLPRQITLRRPSFEV